MRKITGVRFPDFTESFLQYLGPSHKWANRWNTYYCTCKSRTEVRKYAYATARLYADHVDA